MHTGWGGGRGRGRGLLMYPIKRLQKFGHKNLIKHEKRGPPRFYHNLKYPLKRICK
jgi:hypothetical protein